MSVFAAFYSTLCSFFCSRRHRFALRAVAYLGAIGTLSSLSLSLGCARLPPGQNNLSGRRIHVVIRFKSPPEPNFYYYFLINKYGSQGTTGAYGPIAVLGPLPGQNGAVSFGNGFATGSSANPAGLISGLPDYGITDFVLYHTPQQQQGLVLYHFTTNPNQQQFPPNSGQPLSPILPTNSDSDPTAGRTIQFDLDMVQLVTDTTDMTAKIAEARQIRYLQLNIVATNVIPTDPTFSGLKEVDAMGDGLNSSQFNAFREIDLSQARTYTSSDTLGLLSPEPDGDVYPPGSPDQSLDLEYWSIDVQPHS